MITFQVWIYWDILGDITCWIEEHVRYRSSKIILRKKFKKRMEKGRATFSYYVHKKVIFGNCVPIEEDEIVKYIDGISDLMLRDH